MNKSDALPSCNEVEMLVLAKIKNSDLLEIWGEKKMGFVWCRNCKGENDETNWMFLNVDILDLSQEKEI